MASSICSEVTYVSEVLSQVSNAESLHSSLAARLKDNALKLKLKKFFK